MNTKPAIYTLIWTIVILYLSLTPSSGIPKLAFVQGLPIDKAVHFTMYFIHSVLLLNAFKIKPLKVLTLTFCISFGLGVAMEFAQTLPSIERGFETLDMLFNGLGSLAGIAVFKKLNLKTNKA